MNVDISTISVIIPMYNAVKYIKQTVDSVLNQTFKDIEVIVVDDCSTDGSYNFCKSLYENNKRVKIIHHQKNKGVALSRNSGLREAQGKYVTFLDNDDVILPYALELLFKVAEEYKADVVSTCGHVISNDETIPDDFSGLSKFCPDGFMVDKPVLFAPPDETFSPSLQDVRAKLDDYLKGVYGFWCCWNKIYLRSFLMHYDIFFTPYAEDRLFTFRCMFHASRYVKIPNIINVYRNLSFSESRRSASIKDLQNIVKGMNGMALEFNNYMKDMEFFKEYPDYKFSVIEIHMLSLEFNCIIPKYYKNNQFLDKDTFRAVYEKMEEVFGENAPLVNWLFNRYFVLSRILSKHGVSNLFTNML